jgi:hypothetical protein
MLSMLYQSEYVKDWESRLPNRAFKSKGPERAQIVQGSPIGIQPNIKPSPRELEFQTSTERLTSFLSLAFFCS